MYPHDNIFSIYYNIGKRTPFLVKRCELGLARSSSEERRIDPNQDRTFLVETVKPRGKYGKAYGKCFVNGKPDDTYRQECYPNIKDEGIPCAGCGEWVLIDVPGVSLDEIFPIHKADEILVFGKYKGKTFGDIYKIDYQYLHWLEKTDRLFKVDFEELKQLCAENEYEIFLDPFPGYWNCSFINPDWGEDYYGTITAKWKFMDATEYNSGNIHFYIYNVGTRSTSYNVEIGEMESHDGNLDRLTCYYYDLGEPSLNDGALKGTLRKMDTDASPIAFTRVEYHTPSTTLGDNHVDMRTLNNVTIQRMSTTNSVVCGAGQTVSLYGVCAPIMSEGTIKMNPDTSTFDLNNRIEKIVYTIKGVSAVYEKNVGLIREHPTTNLEATEGIFEFKHDFFIPDYWSGKTLELTFSAYDSFGNCVIENAEGPTLYVSKDHWIGS